MRGKYKTRRRFLKTAFVMSAIISSLSVSRCKKKSSNKNKSYYQRNNQTAHLLDRTTVFKHDEIHPWSGCGTIVAASKCLIASWYTGGPKEPHPDNYVVLSRSFDNGNTWSEPIELTDIFSEEFDFSEQITVYPYVCD